MIKFIGLLLALLTAVYSVSKSELILILDSKDDANFELELWKKNPSTDIDHNDTLPETILFKGNRYKIKLNPKDGYVYFRVREIGNYGTKGFWTEVKSTDPALVRSMTDSKKVDPLVDKNEIEQISNSSKSNLSNVSSKEKQNGLIVLPEKEDYVSYLNTNQLNIVIDKSQTSKSKIHYNINDGVWQSLLPGESLYFDEDQDYKLQYFSIDILGNKEETKSIFFRKDTRPPKTIASWMNINSENYESTAYLSPQTLIKLESSDSGSGVKEIVFGVACVNEKEPAYKKYVSPLRLEKIFSDCKSNFRLFFYSVDLVGNAELPQVINIKYSSVEKAPND